MRRFYEHGCRCVVLMDGILVAIFPGNICNKKLLKFRNFILFGNIRIPTYARLKVERLC